MTKRPAKPLRFSPRQARVLGALEALRPGQWLARENLDRIAGSSNGPDVIYQLRGKLGDDAIQMQRVDGIDRDGLPCKTGRYRLDAIGHKRLSELTGDRA